jgi:hypothetical protein
MAATLFDAKQILSFMYVATSVVNQYKYTTANFLDNNDSVSSIPRNYRVLRDRHLLWLKDYIAHVEGSVPDWNSIIDEASYSAAVKRLNDFKRNIASDTSLTQSELQFISDIRTIRISLLEIRREVESLLSSNLLGVVKTQLGSEGVELEVTLKSANDSLNKYIALISRMSAQIRLYLDRRIYLKTTVPTVWLQILDLKLTRLNIGTAAQIIDRIERILNGPQVRASIDAELSNMQARASSLLNIYLCPHLARRVVLGGIARIQELRQNLQTQLITDVDKAAVERNLTNTEQSLSSINNSVASAFKDLPSYIAERSVEVNQQLTSGIEFTGECKSLAISIVDETSVTGNDVSEHARSEAKFVEFKDKCAIPVVNQLVDNSEEKNKSINITYSTLSTKLLNLTQKLLRRIKNMFGLA